jgi:hypothetical protein
MIVHSDGHQRAAGGVIMKQDKLYPRDVLDAAQGLIDEAKSHGITVRELELITNAKARYDALPLEQRASHDYQQRRSFLRGLCPSNRDYGDWCRLVDVLLPTS